MASLSRINRSDRANERRSGEISASAGSANVAKGEHEQNQADAVAKKPDETGAGRKQPMRQMRTKGQSQDQVDDAGDEALDGCNLNGVGMGDLARQVVVYAPRQTRAGDGERAQADA